MFLNQIEKEEINKLELDRFRGAIHLVEDRDTLQRFMPQLMRESRLGFDTEMRPSFRKGQKNKIALIQLATREEAWLIRTNRIGMPRSLVQLLEDPHLLKIGVGLQDDMQRLGELRRFRPDGFLDLQEYVEAFGIESKSLKKLVAIILGFKISKSQQTSDWEAARLSEAQQLYAATDAWVCLEMYFRLRDAVNDTL